MNKIYPTEIKTHLVRVSEAIEEAMKGLDVSSENWCYPVKHFGMPNDHYYAEIWRNGMDWQNTYWIVESANFSDYKVYLLLLFNDHSVQAKFNVYDFDQLLEAICYFRRHKLWIRPEDQTHVYGPYGDSVWPYLRKVDITGTDYLENIEYMKTVEFRHASQVSVVFLLNKAFVSERIMK